ncbi:MAG: DUF3164 family protein [Rhodoferax sp.]
MNTATAITTIPAGYWQDASGNLIPESKVKEIDQVRNLLVYDLCRMAEAESLALSGFKITAMNEVASFAAMSMEQYGVKTGGEKGNITLLSYDGKFKVTRQMQDKISFGEQLMAAKALIDECVHEWAKDANDNIKVMVNHAFQTDKTGKINTDRVLSLRRLDIKDEKWLLAMQAIADSMQTASTKPYIRFYKRCERTKEYLAISLDVAGA